jgi:hypothetical protein
MADFSFIIAEPWSSAAIALISLVSVYIELLNIIKII